MSRDQNRLAAQRSAPGLTKSSLYREEMVFSLASLHQIDLKPRKRGLKFPAAVKYIRNRTYIGENGKSHVECAPITYMRAPIVTSLASYVRPGDTQTDRKFKYLQQPSCLLFFFCVMEFAASKFVLPFLLYNILYACA